jgi:ankyrin repeat protein
MDEVAQEVYEYARRGNVAEAERALAGAHPDAFIAYDGSTAFLMACKNGHVDVCKLLIKHGANTSLRTDEGSSGLLLACSSGNLALVELLIELHSADINSPNEDGLTPLDIALHYSHSEIADLLSKHGGTSSGFSTPDSGEVEAGPSEKWGYGVFDQ